MSRLRVTNVEAIVTVEGDLIVAGTPGTVRCWVQRATEELSDSHLVEVRWDHYLYVGDEPPGDPDLDADCVNTLGGLCAATSRTNLRWYGGGE